MFDALILIDLQNDYFPGGSMELYNSPKAAAEAAKLLETARKLGLPVVHIRHEAARPGAGFFLPGTPGANIYEAVAPLPDETVFVKHWPNAFRETPLQQHLSGLGAKRLLLAGMMTHMCVDTTVRAAADLGYACTLAYDACATRDLSFNGATVKAQDVQTAYLAGLNGLFAVLRSSDELCKEMTARA